MTGELFALLGALAFAVANIAIAQGAKKNPEGDNGAFLSIFTTLIMATLVWLSVGQSWQQLTILPYIHIGILYFMVAGIFSIVLGRLSLFKAVALAGVIHSGFLRRLTPIFAAVLAYFLLNESLSWQHLIGFFIVFSATFYVMVQQQHSATKTSPHNHHQTKLGQLYGISSAFSYGSAYVTRKLGMQYLPDPALGTVIGACTGLFSYLVQSTVNRSHFKRAWHNIKYAGRWQVTTALSMSIGQLAQFFALQRTDVAIVAVIGLLEMFMSAALAAYLFKIEKKPSLLLIVTSIIATAGVLMIIYS